MARAAAAHPGAILQGATRPDPDEEHLLVAPHARSITIDPPAQFGETCNIAYPREVLERMGGFDELFPEPAGEDTDLLQRALEAGVEQVGVPDALTYHAVETPGLLGALRRSRRWTALPHLVKNHPHMRRELIAGVVWKSTHVLLPFAVAGAAVARRHPLAGVALAAPWAVVPGRATGRTRAGCCGR